MDKRECIDQIIFFPFELNKGKKSFRSLVTDAQFEAFAGDIMETDIYNKLEANPGCADAWLGYSSDKRMSSGWFIVKKDNNSFDIGYFDGSKSTVWLTTDNFYSACAKFIVEELAGIVKI